MAQHALLTQDLDIVALVSDRRRNILRFLSLAEAEEIGLVLGTGPIAAGGELVAVGTTALVVQVVIGNAQGTTASLVGQRIEVVQYFSGSGMDPRGGNSGVRKDLPRIERVADARRAIQETEVAGAVASVGQGVGLRE